MGGLFGGGRQDNSGMQESLKIQKEQMAQATTEKEELQKRQSEQRRAMLNSRRRGAASLLSGSETGEVGSTLGNTLG